ncbi:MAG: tetratricopeptide repeat protein [Proteobacteria bacterium]|nr:tetratricopeptide repeat protein [Pseudomonadota bacterium]
MLPNAERAIELNPNYSVAYNWLGLLLNGKGEFEKALAALRVAIDAGWRANWWYFFDHHPSLQALRDEPEFKAMRAEIAADMAEQLKNVQKKAAPPPT